MHAQEAAGILRRHFGVEPAAVRRVARSSFNSWYRVDHADGTFALRVGTGPRVHGPGTEAAEAAWLAALAADTNLGAPEPIADRDGWHGTLAGGRVCSLFTWVPGRPAADRLDRDALVACGQALARIHDHAAGLDAAVAGAPAADRVGRFGGAHRLRAADPWYAEVIDRVERAIAELWGAPPHAPHLLHGDFGPRNVLVDCGRYRPIDFQDLAVGFCVQDLAIAAARLDAGHLPAFRAGYRSVRSWPAAPPRLWRVLVAGRCLDVMATALAAPDAPIAAAFDPYAAELRRWVGSGA